MKPVQLRHVSLGVGRPKICVPLVGATLPELLAGAERVRATQADMVEWRADHFADLARESRVLEAVQALRECLGDMPLLCTIRTAAEGGESLLAGADYLQLTCALAAGGHADAVDVELFAGDEAVKQVVAAAHGSGVAVVVSNHDFAKTPPKAELEARFAKMRALGGDIPKIAVMPNSFADVLELMAATEAYAQTADCPVIAMAMGELGCISRVAGRFYGSAVSFGSLGQASAPGQLAVEDLHTVLHILGE